MACHALGRCRICARKHKIDVFGSAEEHHYMIEKANLKLIILNTVCIVCIAKIERFVKKMEPELIPSDNIKEQDIYERKNDVDRPGITARDIEFTDHITRDKYKRKIETEKLSKNATAMDVDTRDTHCVPTQQPPKKLRGIYTPDEGNNRGEISGPSDIAKNAKVIRPRLSEDSRSSKSQIEREALTKLVSTFDEYARKHPRNDFVEESTTGNPRGIEPAPVSNQRADNEDQNASTSSLSSSISTSNRAENNRDDASPAIKKVGRFLLCDFCKKRFTHAGDLNKHRRKHTGEKPYECGQCQRKFAHASNLARHQRVHSGERPFICPKCDRGFTRRDKLAIHVASRRCQINNSDTTVEKPPVAVT